MTLENPRGSLANLPCEGVSADLDRTIADQRLGFDLREGASAGVDKLARGVSDLGARLIDRSGPAAEGERGRAPERPDPNRTVRIRSGLIEVGSSDLRWTPEI
jgi:hypothetical protein